MTEDVNYFDDKSNLNYPENIKNEEYVKELLAEIYKTIIEPKTVRMNISCKLLIF